MTSLQTRRETHYQTASVSSYARPLTLSTLQSNNLLLGLTCVSACFSAVASHFCSCWEKPIALGQSLQLGEQKRSVYQTGYSLNICSSFARCISVLQSCLQTTCNPVQPEGTVFWGWESDSSAWTSVMEWCGAAPTKHDRSHSCILHNNLPQITRLFHKTNVKTWTHHTLVFRSCYIYTLSYPCYIYTEGKQTERKQVHKIMFSIWWKTNCSLINND